VAFTTRILYPTSVGLKPPHDSVNSDYSCSTRSAIARIYLGYRRFSHIKNWPGPEVLGIDLGQTNIKI